MDVDDDEDEDEGGDEDDDEEEEEEDGEDDHDHSHGGGGGGGGDDVAVNAAALFESMALRTNEVFLFAARMVGRVLELWARNGNDLPAAMAILTSLHSEPWDAVHEARAVADRKLDELARARAIAAGEAGEEEDGEGGEEEEEAGELARKVNEWLADSLTILRALVRERLPAIVALAGAGGGRPSREMLEDWEFDALLAPGVYSRLVGAFELNQVELKIASPVREYVAAVAAAAAAGKPGAPAALAALAPALRQVVRAAAARAQLAATVAAITCEEDDDEPDDGGAAAEAAEEDAADGPVVHLPAEGGLPAVDVMPSHLPGVDGTALFALICTANHSCAPNAAVLYTNGDHAGALVATRAVAAGEEVTINYVDVDADEQERALQLLHYGFTCACSKCVEERKARG